MERIQKYITPTTRIDMDVFVNGRATGKPLNQLFDKGIDVVINLFVRKKDGSGTCFTRWSVNTDYKSITHVLTTSEEYNYITKLVDTKGLDIFIN